MSNIRTYIAFSSAARLIIVAVLLLASANAFSPTTSFSSKQSAKVEESRLNAWSLPNPMDKKAYGTLTNTWYDNHNPTARKVVYNDDPQAETYRFVSTLSDWGDEEASEYQEEQKPQPRGRLRSAASWAARRLRSLSF